MVESSENFQSTAAGRRLRRWTFRPSDGQPVRFGVLMAHGWGDHMACHRLPAGMFTERGGLAVGIDWPGNGKSSGIRGHMGGVDEAVAIFRETLAGLRELTSEVPGKAASSRETLPLLFYAHSTGALFGVKFLAEIGEQTFRAAWLSSPLVRPEEGQAIWKRKIARALAKVIPKLPLDTGVRAARCRRRNPATGSYGDDSGCHPLISAGLGDELARLSERGDVLRWVAGVRDPLRLLVTLGGDDTICPPQFGRELFESLPLSDKTLVCLPGFRHEPMRDPFAQDMAGEVGRWIDQKMAD